MLVLTARDAVDDRVAGLSRRRRLPGSPSASTSSRRGCARFAPRRRTRRQRARDGDLGSIPRRTRLRSTVCRSTFPPGVRIAGRAAGTARHGASKAQLEERLYGWGEEVESNAVEVHVHNLRKKLGADAIRTIRGVGYVIAGHDVDPAHAARLAAAGPHRGRRAGDVATYVETRREIGELFDLQLKQLAYSTRIDDLLRGRPPTARRATAGRRRRVRDRHADLGPRRRARLLVPAGRRIAGPSHRGLFGRRARRTRLARLYARLRRPCAAGRACARRAPRNRRASRAAHAASAGLADPVSRRADLVCRRPWLRPLDALSRAVATRRPDAMAPLAETGLPRELQPLAASLNALLARLDEALSAQRRFTADAAHELRTPLAALTLQVDLAERARCAGTCRRDGRAQGGRGPRGAAGRAAADHGAARTGGAVPDFSRVDLVALANDAIVARAPSPSAEASTWAHRRRSGRGARRCREPRHAARQPARQCVALYARGRARRRRRGRGGRRGGADGDRHGPGIPAAERERVFERFHRGAHADDAAPGTGSGLGLSIVRRIADAHGATVTLDDGAGGKGLAVRVRFPRRCVERAALGRDPGGP